MTTHSYLKNTLELQRSYMQSIHAVPASEGLVELTGIMFLCKSHLMTMWI